MNISFPGPSLTLLLYHRSSTVVWRWHKLLLLVYVQLSSTASTGSLLQGCSFRSQIALDRHRITADSWVQLLQNCAAGLRVPDSAFVRDVCRSLRRAIALTSANLSGDPSPLAVRI